MSKIKPYATHEDSYTPLAWIVINSHDPNICPFILLDLVVEQMPWKVRIIIVCILIPLVFRVSRMKVAVLILVKSAGDGRWLQTVEG
jgi:hypothetical protein